jgi:23S rRNA maturation mini-RNase III
MSIADYMKATGLEAVFGYLYLTGDSARINVLFSKIIGSMEKE